MVLNYKLMKSTLIVLLIFICSLSFGQDVWLASWNKEEPPHSFMSVDDSSAVISLTDDVWGKITNDWNNLFTVWDNTNMMVTGDSITYLLDGDYVNFISLSLSASATGKNWELAIFKNNVLYRSKSLRRSSSVDIGFVGLTIYSEGVIGDDLSLRIRNTTNDDDATIESCQWLIYRLHR